MLVVLITVLAPISGAHFNPAVSLVLALQQHLPAREAVAYVVAQILGAIAGNGPSPTSCLTTRRADAE
jgi:glycerol uptake facilitator-like aquaporin